MFHGVLVETNKQHVAKLRAEKPSHHNFSADLVDVEIQTATDLSCQTNAVRTGDDCVQRFWCTNCDTTHIGRCMQDACGPKEVYYHPMLRQVHYK